MKNEMTGAERVLAVLEGKDFDRQPITGWLEANMSDKICASYGSMRAMEDHYEFDLKHLFSGVRSHNKDLCKELWDKYGELTPDVAVEEYSLMSPDIPESYERLKGELAFHKSRGRFTSVQTPGFFEQYNDIFGIENQLAYLLMYPDELEELYTRQEEWTIKFAGHCIDLGVDMIHISDDWGSQIDLMFNPQLWWDLIYPHLKRISEFVHSRGAHLSLHSCGCVRKLLDGIADVGFEVVHPFQENANMPYTLWLDNYQDKFALQGGINVQNALGVLPQDKLEAEIRRIFSLLRGKRWIVNTSHFVQAHCTMEDLDFAYKLIYKLARE